MKNHFQSAWRFWGLGFLALASVCAAEKPATDVVTRHELWVPTQHWKSLLAKHPNAVMLTPEQYEALVRDAGKIKAAPPDENLPARAVVKSLHFKADATDESSEHLKLEGEMVINCFTDEWTEITARLPFRNLASATVDGGVVLGLPEEIKGDRPPLTHRRLMVKGKGEHRITIVVLGRPGTSILANTRSFAFQSVEVPAVLDLKLPHGAVITQATASYTREGDTAHVLLHSSTSGLREIAWTTSSAITQPARQTLAAGETTITDHSIETAWNIAIQRSTTDTFNTVSFDVIPADAIVLAVEGEGITHWQQTGGKLDLTLRERTQVLQLRAQVQSVLDLQTSTTAQAIALPALRFVGELATDLLTRIVSLAEGVTLMEYQGSTPQLQGYLSWNPVRDTLKVLLRKADPRITVDADAHISVTRDDVQIDRTLQVQTDRLVNVLRLTLPEGEEFISTTSSQGPGMDWKRIGRVLEYRWAEGLGTGKGSSLKLQSRKRLTTANGVPTTSSIKVESLSIPEATKLAGYVALDFDPTWRVSVKTASGLEERDARITPVHGKMAWFALRDFNLAFEVQRRAPVFDADVAAYALPRSKTVEIEGQITLTVSDAPLRQFKVAVTKDRAALVRFTSLLVGEQTLDAASGVWSLTLRKESMGSIPLRFRLSLPADGKAVQKGAENGDTNVTIDARLPSFTVTGARRFHGVWVVEANTDTELTFTPHAMQPLDVLHAPAMEDYQPRHRIVAAFDYAAADASLNLHAARHGHSELAAIVVKSLTLASVLSRDGSSRHQAVLDVSHSGEQFINVQLPPGSSLLASLADDKPVKPVRGPDGTISIPLPAGSASLPSVEVRLLYEIPGEAWSSRGQRSLNPPILPGNIPILATDWQVYTPDGYDIKTVKTNLEQDTKMAACLVAPVLDEPLFLPGGGQSGSGRDSVSALIQKMRTIRFPQVTFSGVSIAQAVQFLAAKSRDLDPAPGPTNRGINIILKAGDAPSTSQISLDLKDVPMEEALRYVTELAGMKYKVEDGRVLILPLTESSLEMHTRVYKVRRNFLNADVPENSPADPFATRGQEPVAPPPASKSAKEFLTEMGIPFPEGSSAVYVPLNSQLVVRNTEPNLDMVDTVVDSQSGRRTDTPLEPSTTVATASNVVEKLRSIILPNVSLSNATLEEAIDYLRNKFRDMDPDTLHDGLSILLNSNDSAPAPKISLDLKNVSMEEALRYVTEIAGMKYRVEPFAVQIVPITESSAAMVTRVIKVPPDFLTKVGKKGLPDAPAEPAAPADPFAAKDNMTGPKLAGRKTAKDTLQETGITFPDGSSAVFNPVTSQLVIRNTEANVNHLESYIDSMPKLDDARREGLLSLDIDLPSSGQLLRFHGPQAPTALSLPYVSADRQIVHALVFMLVGALLFLGLGLKRPFLATLLALILLALGIGLITEEWQPLANATLIGWAVAMFITCIWRLVKAFDDGAVEGRQA